MEPESIRRIGKTIQYALVEARASINTGFAIDNLNDLVIYVTRATGWSAFHVEVYQNTIKDVAVIQLKRRDQNEATKYWGPDDNAL